MNNTDSLRDEIRQERLKALEGKSKAYRIRYYVYYYKWYVIGAVAAFIFIFSLIRAVVTNKESVLGIAVINGVYGADYDSMAEEFGRTLDLDDKHKIYIDPDFTISTDAESGFDMQSEEKLFVRMAAGQLDIIMAPETVFKNLASMGYVTDLGNVLDENELEGYDILIGSVADDRTEAVDDDNAPRHDERSGICITDFARIKSEGWFYESTEPVYMGFVPEGGNTDNAIRFLEYIKKPSD